MNAMAAKVVDASAVIAIIFAEPAAERIAPQISGHALFAPALLGFEIVNACTTRLRRYPDLRDEIFAALALRDEMVIAPAEVAHAGVLVLAERFRLTGYDASYLWLAERLDAELVTLDGPLARAASTLRP